MSLWYTTSLRTENTHRNIPNGTINIVGLAFLYSNKDIYLDTNRNKPLIDLYFDDNKNRQPRAKLIMLIVVRD